MEFAHFGSLRTILRASRGDGVARNLQNGAELIVQLKKTQYTSNDVYKASPDIDANRVPKVSTITNHISKGNCLDIFHTWASQKVQGGPSEIFIAMGGFLGGEGPLFGTFQGGDRPPCAHVCSRFEITPHVTP